MAKLLSSLLNLLIKYLRKIVIAINSSKEIKKFGMFMYLLNLLYVLKKFKFMKHMNVLFKILNVIYVIFTLIIMVSFSGIDFSKLDMPTITIIISALIGLIPLFLLDIIKEVFYNLKEYIKSFLKNIIENVTEESDTSVDTPEPTDGFSFNKNTKEIEGYYNLGEESASKEQQDKSLNWFRITLLICLSSLTLGWIYYYHPEYYDQIVTFLRDKFGGGDGPTGGSQGTQGGSQVYPGGEKDAIDLFDKRTGKKPELTYKE